SGEPRPPRASPRILAGPRRADALPKRQGPVAEPPQQPDGGGGRPGALRPGRRLRPPTRPPAVPRRRLYGDHLRRVRRPERPPGSRRQGRGDLVLIADEDVQPDRVARWARGRD